MAGSYQLKPAFQQLLKPLVQGAANRGMTANQVTIAAIILSGVAGLMLTLWHQFRFFLFIIPVTLFIRMTLNAIDGMLARDYSMKTSLGVILNELGDVISDAMLYLPFALIPGVNAGLLVLIVVLAMISEMAGVLGVMVGGNRRYDGLMGKSDRALVFSVISLLLGFGITPGIWLTTVWLGVLALLVWTIGVRVQCALFEVKGHGVDTPSH